MKTLAFFLAKIETRVTEGQRKVLWNLKVLLFSCVSQILAKKLKKNAREKIMPWNDF